MKLVILALLWILIFALLGSGHAKIDSQKNCKNYKGALKKVNRMLQRYKLWHGRSLKPLRRDISEISGRVIIHNNMEEDLVFESDTGEARYWFGRKDFSPPKTVFKKILFKTERAKEMPK